MAKVASSVSRVKPIENLPMKWHAAEQAAFEMPFIPLSDARALVELYAEKGDRKYERAALKWLGRYLYEANPSLADVAQVAALLAERGMLMRGL
jgi:hypothetical protein